MPGSWKGEFVCEINFRYRRNSVFFVLIAEHRTSSLSSEVHMRVCGSLLNQSTCILNTFNHVPRTVSCVECFRSMGCLAHSMCHLVPVHKHCRSLVCIAGNKLDLFPVGLNSTRAALSHQLHHFIDRISRHSQVVEVFHFGGLRISSLLYCQ